MPVKGNEPGAFVITSKKDGQKYIMGESTLNKILEKLGETLFDRLFTVEWVVLDEGERKLAEEIRRKYFTKAQNN